MPFGDPTNNQEYLISADMTVKLVDNWGVIVVYHAQPARSIAALENVVIYHDLATDEIWLTRAFGAEIPGTVINSRPGGPPPDAPIPP
jgi:hypothetical protein